MAKLGNFRTLWDEYPLGTSDEVKKRIGGGVDVEWITNTCVIRVCRSLNYAGFKIPSGREGLMTVKGGDGLRYAIRVKEFKTYLRQDYGAPQVTHAYADAGGPVPPTFLGKQGIICFDVSGWADATGHFDLWDGERCINHDYFERASKVHLWVAPDGGGRTQQAMPRPRELSASVGVGGINRPDDVRLVQKLLRDRGIDPGPVDGVMGEKTVAAIKEFQKRFVRRPDGRVDPGGRTWQELNGL
jgi:hypothetical protein